MCEVVLSRPLMYGSLYFHSASCGPTRSLQRRSPVKRARKQSPTLESDDVVLLEDLAPMADVRGGAGKLRFGQSLPVTSSEATLPNEVTAAQRTAETEPPPRTR